jgi:hypothetical protein
LKSTWCIIFRGGNGTTGGGNGSAFFGKKIPVNYLKSTQWIIFRGGNGTTGGGNGSASFGKNTCKLFEIYMVDYF